MKRILFSLFLILTTSTLFALPDLIEKQAIKTSGTNTINLDLAWEDVEIQESNQSGTIIVEIYCNKKKWAPEIKASGSSVTVKSISLKNYISIGEQRKCTVIVKIPDNTQLQTINLETTSGDIHSQTVINADSFSTKSSSGDQSFTSKIFAKTATFASTSGDIFVDSLYSPNLKASSTSGSIKFNTYEGQNASLGATSGSIKLTNATIEKGLINTTSGSITVEGTISNAFDVSATSGTIGLELNSAPSSRSRATATSGTIFVGLPGNDDFSLWVQTTSGTFTNAITKEKISSHANYKQDINKGGVVIMLSSTSGRITVDSSNGFTAKIVEDKIDTDVPIVSFDDPIF